MGFELSEATAALLDGRNYAVLATVNPDGSHPDRPGAVRVVVRLRMDKATGRAA
jgi:hypothetical protein